MKSQAASTRIETRQTSNLKLKGSYHNASTLEVSAGVDKTKTELCVGEGSVKLGCASFNEGEEFDPGSASISLPVQLNVPFEACIPLSYEASADIGFDVRRTDGRDAVSLESVNLK